MQIKWPVKSVIESVYFHVAFLLAGKSLLFIPPIFLQPEPLAQFRAA